ncbi:hypothetical protein FJN13_02220 [Alteromonas mediterranea]|uniref:hypothetical protein n=1 Tax=Alteromonas mediterranea TaxID=314275 RepID=UPI00113251E3|nr:hypothetical protein [Alteromonas mediterranea]QDG33684.1 hypothetical protein FJN13_02220 [Alteromonas mediterranea]
MLNKILTKLKSFGKPDPSEIVGELIKADEMCKLEPELSSQFQMSYEEYREALKNEYLGTDMANEIANTPAVGELTIEQHARKIVQAYHGSQELNPWYSSIIDGSKSASSRAFQAYGN